MTSTEPQTTYDLQATAGALADRLAGHATPVRLHLAALALALSAHAALLYALAWPAADALAGARGQQLDAISVTIVSPSALESLTQDAVQQPAPLAAGTVEANEGTIETPPAPPQQDQEKETAKQETTPEPAESAAIIPTPREEQKQDRKQSIPVPVGGVTSRGNASTTESHRAPTAASAGAIREYARYVAQALAKARPKGLGTVGTVKVKLVVAPGGGLASVEVVGSSGNKKLDAMAIAAVQHTALPRPPPGLTPTQLTYEVPYHFR